MYISRGAGDRRDWNWWLEKINLDLCTPKFKILALHLMVASTWFVAMTWMFARSFFNHSGFSWLKIVDCWVEWNKWMMNQGGIGVQPEKSWESWWIIENVHLCHSVPSSRILEAFLSLRFLCISVCNCIWHLRIWRKQNLQIYLLSRVVVIVVVGFVKVLYLENSVCSR